ncbi:superoxide dismutase family protein [Bordetella genomosp. 12]|uniref:Superoxide dismutase n=1 Tax=Bordetella genomosp. 12 TaxID=463035 RepID=A0A261VAX6_9BORD|nr:superoxide dismutase family protein [Bordetella genomosp. 12]OZI71135.1 superoxide dismutase [Bordetella genomosp. 12]
MKFLVQSTLCAALLAGAGSVAAQTVDMYAAGPNGPEQKVGTIKIEQTKYGTLLTPILEGLPPGVHGFHLHDKPSCDATTADGKPVAAGAAGGHWDPDKSNSHKGPYDDSGHKGDLPALYVMPDGKANYPVLAPRLKASELKGHALMIHAGGDNHSDHPMPLGGGGARILCGVVK